MDSAMLAMHSLCSSALYLASQCLSLCALSFFPFLCLNGILLSLFLLKSLFFKPKFVENRLKTIAIDPGQNSSDFHLDQLNTTLGGIAEQPGDSGNETGLPMECIRTLITSHIQQLYTNDSAESLEYISPSNDLIKLKEKIGSGFVGVLYKLHMERHEQFANSESDAASSKCAKLVDLKGLRKIIEEVNGLGGVLTGGLTLASLFKSSTKRSVLASKLLQYYRLFLDSARKLEAASYKSRSLSTHVLFYEQVLLYDGKCLVQRARHKKMLKSISQADKRHLPTLVLMVMAQAKMNLRCALISEWASFGQNTTSEWGRQIGQGLLYLHQTLGMAHLNLKPENILLFEEKTSEAKNFPLHQRYLVKLTDCANSFLLVTSNKVLSQSHETSVYALSCPGADKFTDQMEESQGYDIYCFAMTLLLMLVGYESFGKTFVLSQFPTGLVSTARYRLMQTIEAYDRARIPQTFVDLFRQVFSINLSNTGLTVQQMLKHVALQPLK